MNQIGPRLKEALKTNVQTQCIVMLQCRFIQGPVEGPREGGYQSGMGGQGDFSASWGPNRHVFTREGTFPGEEAACAEACRHRPRAGRDCGKLGMV